MFHKVCKCLSRQCQKAPDLDAILLVYWQKTLIRAQERVNINPGGFEVILLACKLLLWINPFVKQYLQGVQTQKPTPDENYAEQRWKYLVKCWSLVPGEACGKLVEVDRIEPGALDGTHEPVVLLVKEASGDEEIGAAGVDLKGVILCHGLPHLSHLGELTEKDHCCYSTWARWCGYYIRVKSSGLHLTISMIASRLCCWQSKSTFVWAHRESFTRYLALLRHRSTICHHLMLAEGKSPPLQR